MKYLKMACVCLVVALVFIAAYFIIKPFIEEDKEAIDFSGGTASGEVLSLSDNFGKTGTVLCFFDPQAEQSLQLVEQLVDTVNGRADIIAVAVTDLEAQDALALMSDKIKTIEHLIVDGTEAVEKYRISSPPITYFIDRDGLVISTYLYKISDKSLNKELDKLAKE